MGIIRFFFDFGNKKSLPLGEGAEQSEADEGNYSGVAANILLFFRLRRLIPSSVFKSA